jgi:hypothetical protein
MDYPYPPEFPNEARADIKIEKLRAAEEFDQTGKCARSISEIETALREYILRVFMVFATGAFKLGQERIWSVDRVESEAREFLRRFTINAWYEKAYDRAGNRLREMISNWDGSILPDTQRQFEKSAAWKRYEAGLLAVAERQSSAGNLPQPATNQSAIKTKAPATIIDDFRKAKGLTIEKLSKQLRVDPSVIYALKRGVKTSEAGRCSPETLAHIADVLGCKPEDLLSPTT